MPDKIFQLFGRTLQCFGLSGEIIQKLSEAQENYVLNTNTHNFILKLYESKSNRLFKEHAPEKTGYSIQKATSETIFYTSSGDHYFLGDELNGAHYQTTGNITFWWKDLNKITAILLSVITKLLQLDGFYFLHAAGITQKSKCALLLGQSGAGKTTTLFRAALNGWAVLCEDSVYFDKPSNRLYSFEKGLALRQGALKLVPKALESSLRFNPVTEKHFLHYQDLCDYTATPRKSKAELTDIIILMRDEAQENQLKQIPKRFAAPIIWQTLNTSNIPELEKKASDIVRHLCQSTTWALDLAPIDSELHIDI